MNLKSTEEDVHWGIETEIFIVIGHELGILGTEDTANEDFDTVDVVSPVVCTQGVVDWVTSKNQVNTMPFFIVEMGITHSSM